MAIKIFKNFFKRMFTNLFSSKREIKLGFYGPPNAGKTSLANRICKDFTGEEIGTVSKIPHETRKVQFKEKVEISYKGKKMVFKMIDTPGIATKIDYEDFLKFKMSKKILKKEQKKQHKELLKASSGLMTWTLLLLFLMLRKIRTIR